MHKAEQAALRELGSAMEAPQQQAGLMQVYKLAFHGTKYSITLNVQDGILSIEVEQEEAPHARWCGEFTSAYIEDITSKVGALPVVSSEAEARGKMARER